MAKVIIHLIGGGSYETTDANLPNTQRLMAGKISGIEYENGNQNLADAIDDELVVEEITNNPESDVDDETRNPTLDELKGTDKDVLKKMADDLAEAQGITKVNGRSGVDKLAEYIFKNQ